MKEKKLLIFDFDGVLVNTLPDIIASVGGALKATGVEDCTEEIISNSIGGGARKGMIKCLGPDRTHLLRPGAQKHW